MKIGELAKKTGIAAHTIRFYESKGLLPKAKRGANGYRLYGQDASERLTLIQFSQRMGFTLEEIFTLFNKVGDNWDHDLIMGKLESRLNEIRSLQKQLTAQEEDIIKIQNKLKETWSKNACMQTDDIAKIVADAG